jgi:hypothetical protein
MLLKQKVLALFVLLTAVTSFGCFESKTVVTRVSPPAAGKPRPKMNGVMFALPRTVVKVDVPVVRERRSEGQFYALSPFFFPGEKFIEAGGVPAPPALPNPAPPALPNPAPADPAGLTFSLDAPKFGSRGKPDPDETFMVSIRGGRFETKTLLLDVTEDGIIAKAEAESKDETIDFVTSSLKTVATIAAPLLPFGVSAEARLANLNQALERSPQLAAMLKDFNKKQMDKVIPADVQQLKDAIEDAFLELLTAREKLIYSSLDTDYKKFLRNEITFAYLLQLSEDERDFFWTLTPAQITYFKALSAQHKADLPRAKIAYDRIQSFIRQREDLVRSEPQPASPAETLTKKLAEIDDYIKTYKESYFLGRRAKSSWTGNFEFDVQRGGVLSLALFDYSETEGICTKIRNGIGGKTVSPPRHFMDQTPNPNPASAADCVNPRSVSLRLDVPAAQIASYLDAASPRHVNFDASGERGFYYRVPAKVTAVLLDAGDEVSREEMAVAQLGQTASLPASTGGRRSSYKVVYYDASGAVKTFNIGSDALIQKSNADDVGATVTELRDAELKRLERETKKLNAEKDRIEAEKALKKAKEDNANANTNTNANN